MVQIVADEIEEGTNVRIGDAFGVRLVALGESIQEPQDIIGCDLIDFLVTEFQTACLIPIFEGENAVIYELTCP